MDNGTDCLWSGGLNDQESNYYQYTLRRPDPKRELKYTVCAFAINVSLSSALQGTRSSLDVGR